uniref:U58-Sparatoxin-Hju1a_1 n=1 Tax=Heteropoda jugulans TaxID=1358901 RepID=A0A4Q8K252_9ARAC
MKLTVLLAVLCVTVVYAKHLDPEYEKFLEETAVGETERECIEENKDCKSNQNGCCPTDKWLQESYCHCYLAAKDKKRYNTVSKAEEKCFCDTQVSIFG